MRNTVISFLMAAFMMMAAMAFIPDKSLANSAPEFDPIATQTVMEGSVFSYTVTAVDIDGDPITIVAVSRPVSSTFIDNGDGTADFKWEPEYTGPNSSEGSPFVIHFMASDGTASDQIQANIIVSNNNRKPAINPVDIVEYEAGELVSITVTGYDPDNDEIGWNLLSAPSQISFSSDIDASLNWQTIFADSGFYDISIELADIYGAADTADIALNILPKAIYTLSIDTISAYPGETISMDVNLMNLEEVGGFNLLINYDVSALLLSYLWVVGTRAEAFEYFTYSRDNNNIKGDVLITGVADIDDGVTTDNLSAGDGPLVNLTFYVTNDLTFSGFSIPVKFAFRNLIDKKDNTLTDIFGETIGQEAINYEDGYIIIKQVDISGLGDINLNGVTYEIADAVYFTNFFIDPGHYPLDPERRANTDVNQDGLSGSVADLVFLINYLINPNNTNKLRPTYSPVEITNFATADNFSISCESDIEIGGLALTLKSEEPIYPQTGNGINIGIKGMTIKSAVDGKLLRLLIYSEDGTSIPAGINDIISMNNDNKLVIKEIEFSSADGVLLKTIVSRTSQPVVPSGFILEQNYPNPFNPITEIGFSLPKMSKVNLTVYNVLGQEVINLIESSLPSGNHRVIWDGRNELGAAVGSGLYFYRLTADDFEAKRKMTLLK